MMNNPEEIKVEIPNNPERNKKPLIFLALFFFVFLPIYFIISSGNDESSLGKTLIPEKSNQVFDNLSLESKSVMVWDIKNQKEIYSRNKETQLPLASITKIMMAVVALDNAPEGTIVTINESDLREEGDTGLKVKERWEIRDLIDFSLVVSSNDGALAVANAVGSQINKDDGEDQFTRLMNIKAKEINLTQTYFISPSGLDKDNIIPGGNGSAKDVATLFEYTLKKFPDILEATSFNNITISSLDLVKHKAKNTNSLVEKLPGIIASKTGFTDLAGGNLAVVFEPEPGRPIVLVALGSSGEGRFLDIEKLYLTTLDYIN